VIGQNRAREPDLVVIGLGERIKASR